MTAASKEQMTYLAIHLCLWHCITSSQVTVWCLVSDVLSIGTHQIIGLILLLTSPLLRGRGCADHSLSHVCSGVHLFLYSKSFTLHLQIFAKHYCASVVNTHLELRICPVKRLHSYSWIIHYFLEDFLGIVCNLSIYSL